jgi:hypothetical protein
MITRRHLRLVPKPLAKCEPYRYPAPRLDGVTLRRHGRDWLLMHTRGGRFVETVLTTEELRDLHNQAGTYLAMEADDHVDE